MIFDAKEFHNPNLLIAAAETEDEVGTVLRMHLAIEQILVWFIRSKRTTDLAPYVKEPREFGNKLALAAAFGLPLVFVRVIHQVNLIRNKLAHGTSSLGLDQVQELGRQVDKIEELDSSFVRLDKRYLELPLSRPGERIVFGSGGARLDFLLAAMTFLHAAMMWAALQGGSQDDAQFVIPAVE